jgi:hypothetical protein
MQAILWGRLSIGNIVNVEVISLDQAPEATVISMRGAG